MDLVAIYFVFAVFLVSVNCFKNSKFEDHFSEDDDELQHCVCVPYWQCKEDFSGLIEDGIDIMDIRFLRNAAPSDVPSPCTGDFDVCCQVECGKRRTLGTVDNRIFMNDDVFGFRILGTNNEAEFAEFPWMLGILEGRIYRCGASLIHPRVAMTAAHCVTGNGPFTVRAGEWNWETKSEPLPHQDRIAKKILIHEHYHPNSLRNDIALLILESPFKLAENVGLACLPREGTVFDHLNCVTSGWGKNSFKKGTYQSTLKKTDLPVVPRSHCLNALQMERLGPFFKLHRSFICAGGEYNKDTCKGDGGSPLVCPVKGQPGRYEQAGIVSWGLTCGLRSTPGVYVNVALFSQWIDNKMMQLNFDTNVYRL